MFVNRIVSIAILQLSILFTLSYGVNPDENPFPHWSNDPAARFQVTFINTKPAIVNAFSQVLDTAYFPKGIKVESELVDFERLQRPYDCVGMYINIHKPVYLWRLVTEFHFDWLFDPNYSFPGQLYRPRRRRIRRCSLELLWKRFLS
ncbi:hypothetical protein BKA69DRAFT_508599 [Paraphysoderma sedebokerense]|nr:hypothetical protein BKA69DRAFT_508599 [Paraphysoderma sedebokerense]